VTKVEALVIVAALALFVFNRLVNG